MWQEIISQLYNFIGILVAAVLGSAIGFERKLRRKEAGIGTHTVVCVGAALIMVVSKYGFSDGTADASRVAAQIVSGIGFIGAGIIAYRQQKMRIYISLVIILHFYRLMTNQPRRIVN